MRRSVRVRPADPVMARDERYAWIESYIRDHGGVDVLNRWFVEAYASATNMGVIPTCIGADIAPALGKDLAHMYKVGRLARVRVGLSGNWEPGFPKWVWSYDIREEN